jgi:predicted negative regulator of RcsB-dependent stress response
MYYFYAVDIAGMKREIDHAVESAAGGDQANDLLAVKALAQRCSTPSDHAAFAAYAHGRYALFLEKTGEAADSLAVAAQDTTTVVSSAAMTLLAGMHRKNGDLKTAHDWLRRAASAAADTTAKVEALMEAGDILVAMNDTDGARTVYMEALASYPGTVYDSIVRRKLRTVMK